MIEAPTCDLRISLLQHISTPNDIEAGKNRLEKAAREAAAHGSALLVTPECGITGYDISQAEAQESSFASAGPVADSIAQIARRHAIGILYGFMESDGRQRFNAIQFVDDNGTPLLHYRKTHLWGDLDRELFSAGEKFSPVINYKGWNLAGLICYDVEFPENVRCMALAGAQLILVPTALMRPYRFIAEQVVPVRAAESQVFIAYANLVGQENNTTYEGCSTIADPEGKVLARASADHAQLIHLELTASAFGTARTALPYYRDRRPELYGSLASRTRL